jgi:hypothetical protein
MVWFFFRLLEADLLHVWIRSNLVLVTWKLIYVYGWYIGLLLVLLVLFILHKIIELPISGREAFVTNIKLASATVPEDRKIV